MALFGKWPIIQIGGISAWWPLICNTAEVKQLYSSKTGMSEGRKGYVRGLVHPRTSIGGGAQRPCLHGRMGGAEGSEATGVPLTYPFRPLGHRNARPISIARDNPRGGKCL